MNYGLMAVFNIKLSNNNIPKSQPLSVDKILDPVPKFSGQFYNGDVSLDRDSNYDFIILLVKTYFMPTNGAYTLFNVLNTFISFSKNMSVRIRNATIIGNENVGKLTGRTYYSYLGIPYAKPPIGELRFQVSNYCFY